MHRDVHFVLDLLDNIHHVEDWLRTHLPDLHELAYGQPGGGDAEHVQTSTHRDVGDRLGITQPRNEEEEQRRSDRIGTSPQHAWHTLVKLAKSALLDLERAEYATGEQFTAGTTPEPDRPGRDTTMPPPIAKQVHAAAARRKQRGEWAPAELKEAPRP